ncbi:MAG: helix-turn-helix domain-containing protein [Eubacterium sp.]|nr:helix-turn-helix domain-containing protein [Eubacterium sp.]
MNHTEKLQQAIRELQRLTGLPFEIRTDDLTDLDDTIERLQSLSQAYRNANRKEDVIRRWLSGNMADEDFFAYADRMHIDRSGRKALYLIQFQKEIYPEITLVLRNIFPDSRTWILPYNQTQILVINHISKHADPVLKETAYQLLDALNTELMEQVQIATSAIAYHTEDLPGLCRQCLQSMQIGSIFYPDRIIYGHDELGIGSILYDASDETCRAFIRDQIGDRFLTEESPAFDTDIKNTANTFLNNNMNIAETARQLHIHRNTLLYRLEQIENETGLDIRNFEQAMIYRICSMILLYVK